ncbi:signal peptidase II [Candidatus Woesebacteria bacterium]|nr:signal peptidase II [Candidatus Woesebacteria bacterium]
MLNKGIAFGWAEGLPDWVGILTLCLLMFCAVKTRELYGRIGLGLVITGGLVNTYQRVYLGGVVDNLPMFGLGYNNLADYLIFFGIFLYGYSYFVRRPGHRSDR